MFETKPLMDELDYLAMKGIIINGRPYTIEGDTLTFGELAILGGYSPNDTPTITYRNGRPLQSTGTLVPGDHIAVLSGMMFNVVVTDGA